MAVVAKKAATSKAVPKTVKPKAPPKPKLGEVGYRFPVMMEIVETNPDDDNEYAFVIALALNEWGDYDSSGHKIGFTFSYPTRESLLADISKHDKKVTKQLKTDELNKAKAEVARLTKELAAIK